MKTIWAKLTKPGMQELEDQILSELKQNNGEIILVLCGMRSTKAEFFTHLYHEHNVLLAFEFGNRYILELRDGINK